MKFIIVVATVVVAVSAVTEQELWKKFKENYKKSYQSSLEEHQRFTIFQHNLRKIEEHNIKYEQKKETYYLGITKFTDMTNEEFKMWLGSSKATIPQMTEHTKKFKPSNKTIPESIDWREKGAVREVKEQGCGDCWAFSVTGVLEGQLSILFNDDVILSEQNLLDCSWPYGNQGCTGGVMTWAYLYIQENGIESETNYPYLGKDNQTCKFEKFRSVLTLDSYIQMDMGNEADMKDAVANVGPISVGVDSSDMSLYAGGIYHSTKCSNTINGQNHAILVVGYGTENGQDYWIVKNSWGSKWGEHGYIRMLRNVNQCGIALAPSYPNLV